MTQSQLTLEKIIIMIKKIF